jgi:hypothetical protein
MPVHLSVSLVRNEIMRIAGHPEDAGDQSPSTRLLGGIFHDSFAKLLGQDDQLNWKTALMDAPADATQWRHRLVHHLYDRLIGPAVRREQVYLHHMTSPLIDFWQASRQMCLWIVSLLWDARNSESRFEIVFSPEQEGSISFFEPGWTDSVVVSGIADLVVKMPQCFRPGLLPQNTASVTESRPPWCVVEFKLGISCPEADLAQVCLYHQMISEQIGQATGAMAIIRFSPHKTERIFMPDDIQEARNRLKNMIARMAGVLPDASTADEHPAKNVPIPPADPSVFSLAERLISIFREYGKEVSLDGDPIAGPTFIRSFIKLGRRVKLSAVQSVSREVQHRMELSAPPCIGIAEGRLAVDIQRPDRQIVHFPDIRHQLPTRDPACGCSRIILGVDLTNTLRMADMADPENAHILVAGTTGSGKSEWIRTAIAGLLLTNTPDTLRLMLIDPKRDAFTDLKGSPFLLHPRALVYPDEQPVELALAELVDEMERRYQTLQQAGADTLNELRYAAGTAIPRIVCVCEEYVDLVSRSSDTRKKIEAQIFRLGAKARTAGIHLMIATQNPSRQIIKGTLDVNLPARVGLKVGKGIDSILLLNEKGAENLLGAGDLLFKNIGEPIRLQSPLLSPEERRRIFFMSTQSAPCSVFASILR